MLMKILVVDDDREIVELLTIYLKNEKLWNCKSLWRETSPWKIKNVSRYRYDYLGHYDATLRRNLSGAWSALKENAQLPNSIIKREINRYR